MGGLHDWSRLFGTPEEVEGTADAAAKGEGREEEKLDEGVAAAWARLRNQWWSAGMRDASVG
jgi:hypothetical protein